MNVPKQLQALAGVALAGTVALIWPFAKFTTQPLMAVQCGSLNTRAVNYQSAWGNFSSYALNDSILQSRVPVGLYSAEHEGLPVGLLDLFYDGDSSNVKSLEMAGAADEFTGPQQGLAAKVEKIQSFLSHQTLAYDSNDSNPQATQIAIWSVTSGGPEDFSLASGMADQKAWQRYIDDAVSGINRSSARIPKAPFEIDARLSHWQWPGWISIDAMMLDIDGAGVRDVKLSASTVGTASEATTDAHGKATIYLRDPAQGAAQTYLVRWSGLLPPGSLFKVVYNDKYKVPKDARADYMVTAQTIPVNGEITVYLPEGWCRGSG